MLKLPRPPNNFGIQSVKNYYKKCNSKESLIFVKIESYKLFKILKNLDPTIDDFSGIFLNDGALLLATPITQLCNMLTSSSRFPDACKIAKLKPLFKKTSQVESENYRPVSFLPICQRCWRD